MEIAPRPFCKNLSGILSDNKQKEELSKERDTSKWPDVKGYVEIEGVRYWLSGWKKEAKQGKFQGEAFISLTLEKADTKDQK